MWPSLRLFPPRARRARDAFSPPHVPFLPPRPRRPADGKPLCLTPFNAALIFLVFGWSRPTCLCSYVRVFIRQAEARAEESARRGRAHTRARGRRAARNPPRALGSGRELQGRERLHRVGQGEGGGAAGLAGAEALGAGRQDSLRRACRTPRRHLFAPRLY